MFPSLLKTLPGRSVENVNKKRGKFQKIWLAYLTSKITYKGGGEDDVAIALTGATDTS